jgi:hypothetical protein
MLKKFWRTRGFTQIISEVGDQKSDVSFLFGNSAVTFFAQTQRSADHRSLITVPRRWRGVPRRRTTSDGGSDSWEAITPSCKSFRAAIFVSLTAPARGADCRPRLSTRA